MADVLRPLGYATTDTAEGADFVILNTCHIREKAAEKVYSELGKLRAMKDGRAAAGQGSMTIAVAIDSARATLSVSPVIVRLSPRRATRVPVARPSSTRLPSLTPASICRSAPSTETRVVAVSGARPVPFTRRSP
jgi:hypothetical protein